MAALFAQAREFSHFGTDLFRSRRIILALARNDFQNRFLGSYLGLIWAIIHPVATVSILIFVFGVAFQGTPQDGVPFALWLVAGIIPWLFFAEAWSGATASVAEYSYLVKKVVFRVSMLPLVKLLAALPIHLFLLIFAGVVFVLYGHVPGWHLLQLPYYGLALLLFLMGLSWLSAALFIFLRDVSQVIAVLLQFGFWLTPIVWSLRSVPESIQPVLLLNPLYYIIAGYRDAFIGSAWFWDKPLYTAYFWVLTTGMFVAGALVFARLRPHFADVL
jgi:ABC-type polysaccharide/polyol phosphate export permease